MVRADELYNEVTNDSSGKGASQGMFIGCFVDAATGFVTFTCEGKDTSHKFKVILGDVRAVTELIGGRGRGPLKNFSK